MNRNGIEARSLVLLGLLFCIYIPSSLFFLVPAANKAARGGWDGYYTLLVPAAEADEELTASLEEAGFDAVVSRDRSSVKISNYNGVEDVPLDQLEDRLAPMDPRMDPFLSSVGELFQAGADGTYEVYYLASEAAVGTVRERLDSVFEETTEWELAGTRETRGLLFVTAFLGVAVLLTVCSRRPRTAAAGAAVPWLGFTATAGAGGFVAAAAVYFAWVVFADTGRRYLDHRLQYRASEESRRELRYSALVLAGTWALALGLSPDRSIENLGSVFVSTSGMVAWTGILVFALVLRRRRQDHRLFVPVAMRAATPVTSAAVRYASTAPWVALIVVAAPYLATLLPQQQISAVPQPVPLSEFEEIEFEALHALEQSSSSGLVNVADYIAHRAYQEGFVYGADYGVPDAGSELTVSRYAEGSQGIELDDEVMLRYDDRWLDRTLEDAAQTKEHIGALLLNGSVPSGVVRSSPAGIYSPRTHPARYSLQALLAFLPFVVFSIRVFLTNKSGAPTPMLRRKRQAA
ncbi:MAG: hypothetical protein ACQETQ_01345 [Spirochaetota bacterium]